MSYKKNIKKLVDYHGVFKTFVMAIEELSESQKTLTKYLRKPTPEVEKDIVEEMADVLICFSTIIEILEIDLDNLEEEIERKMKRNLERIE